MSKLNAIGHSPNNEKLSNNWLSKPMRHLPTTCNMLPRIPAGCGRGIEDSATATTTTTTCNMLSMIPARAIRKTRPTKNLVAIDRAVIDASRRRLGRHSRDSAAPVAARLYGVSSFVNDDGWRGSVGTRNILAMGLADGPLEALLV